MNAKLRVLAAAVLLFAVAPACLPQTTKTLRISLENRAAHVQARMLELFLEKARSAAGPALKIELYTDAALFRDTDVVSAVSLGKVEMGVPGIWQLDRFAPDMAALMLPSVHSASEEAIAGAVDGRLGSHLSAALESALEVKVLGRWLELGSAHTFFVGNRERGFGSLRVRVAGGLANEERFRVLGSTPVVIPWPDLPAHIRRGTVDAVVTSYETVDSAALEKAGLGAVLEESLYVGYYVPLVNRRFWEGLDARTRSALAAAWEETVAEARPLARAAQAEAKARLAERGVRVRVSAAGEREARRRMLLSSEAAIAEKVHVSAAALDLLRAALGTGAR